jgi:RNA polymerase sigma-70 factor (ECF subfamily)
MGLNVSANDVKEVDALFRRYYKPLRAYAFRFVNDWIAAEDIVQDVFFELWTRRDSIRFNEAVSSYLFKAVYSRSINFIKSNLQNNNCSLNERNECNILDQYIEDHMQNQERSLLLDELEAEIKDFVESLPAQCQKIFILSRNYHLKNHEIANQLSISVKAVEKQITKALSELKLHLRKKGLLFFLFLFNI